MDKETLRKQLYDELHSQFEEKLREAKKQKSELEEELEVSSEKWRNERRRLNSEIDRLENKLGEAREASRKPPEAKQPAKPVEVSGLGKLQAAAAEEKLKKATQEWEAERKKLQGEISRLQGGIAELIERSNNPLRSNQLEKDKLDTKLEEALRAKRLAEDALVAARAEWETEKLKLVSDSVKLRRPGPAKPVRSKDDEDRIEQLQKDLEKARGEASRIKQSYTTEIDVITAQLDTSKKERANLERQLRNAEAEREKSEQEAEKARQTSSSEKSDPSEPNVRLKEQLEDARAEAKAAARRLEETKAAATKEKVSLEKQLRDATTAQQKLERDLDKARQAPSSAKDAASSEITRLRSELENARSEAKEAKATATKERSSLEKQLRDASGAQEKLERELDKLKQAPAAAKDSHASEVARLKQDLEAARTEAKLAATKANEVKTAADKERAGFEKQLRDASSAQEKLERTVDKMKQSPGAAPPPGLSLEAPTIKDLEAARAEARMAAAASRENAATIARLNTELKEAQETIRTLKSGGAPTNTPSSDNVNSEIVEQLRQQYDERMQAMIQEKSELSEQLRNVTSMLEDERKKLGAAEATKTTAGSNGLNTEMIDAEVARIQEMIAGIARLIDDPETELSTVIRKNVERAELDAYLKGILFSLGRGRGL